MRFVWRNLPVFFIWFIGLSVLNNSLHHIAPPVENAGLLSFFPLACSIVLLWFSCKGDYGDEKMLKPFFAWTVGLTALYLTPFMHGLSMPFDINTQRLIYEFSALAQFAILLTHAKGWFTRNDWIWVFGVTLVFGLILENGGIVLGFFSEPGYLLYLPGVPAPLATALGWVNVLYCAFFAVERLLPRMPPLGKGLVCAFMGLSLDIPFDPVATRLEWWVWDPSLSVRIWDVPVVNFIAWFWALFPYAALYYWMRGREGYGEKRKVIYFVGSFPLILAGEFLGVIASLALVGDRAGLIVIRKFFSALFLS
jgi:hypothetical protein